MSRRQDILGEPDGIFRLKARWKLCYYLETSYFNRFMFPINIVISFLGLIHAKASLIPNI